MIFSDMQTKHFYALKSSNVYDVKTLENSDLLRVILYASSSDKSNNKAMVTTDIIDRKLIKHIKINEVKPTYFRQWTVTAPASVAADTTYYVYFYLENMLGFGMQDRWDRVAAYTAKAGDTVATVMTALKNDLDSKLNGAGPIKGDFTVTSGSSNSIVVAENPNSSTFKEMSELYLRTHGNPYAYHVTMSTGKSVDGAIEAWSDAQKEIKSQDTNVVYIKPATKVLAMELYFLRNRGDLYDLSKNFYASILNEANTDTTAEAYYTLDIDYAFSDTQGYTYHSDKQMSFAVPSEATAEALMTAITGASENSGDGE